MLRICDIHKKYVTGELVQTALDGVSLTLRDSEFVAVLGPSGSGKTTLLNVIGGLDRYDSGDLIINGVSTRKYSDRDWDSYRNHTVGFVFQSYNLIPHQTVLSNVELALTISGISRTERKKRASQALEAVGLGDQLHKRPNQMSGGQMQRVAIARALVNNPDILLADEPTGALDSETSVQVMELLKEVSKDRLVVMVTHNPELAEEYANRIVRVRDGRVIDDTNPYVVETDGEEPAKHQNMGKASMSFWTALSLSFNNLRTKKGRTILTAFAGSIGIIGIALILSLSTGFQMYIDQIQEDTLSNYPLSIQTETTDMASMMSAFGNVMTAGKDAESGVIVEQQMLTQMFAQVGTNDLESFKAYYEDNQATVASYINAVKYSYGIKPRIYSTDTSNGIFQVNPGELFGQMTNMGPMAAMMDTDVFYELLDNQQMLESQYQVVEGKWPESREELVVVLNSPSQISDYMAYTLGLKKPDRLFEIMEKVAGGEEVEFNDEPDRWTYADLMNLSFRLVSVADTYRYNAQYGVWEDMSDNQTIMRSLIDNGMELRIVGIVTPKENTNTTLLTDGVAYTHDLTQYVIDQAASKQIVKNQLAKHDINVFTGKPFGEKEPETQLDFQDMINIDPEMITSAFGMNVSTSGIQSMIEAYLKDAYNSMYVDTEPAEAEFTATFSVLAKGMLADFISANADAQGKAQLKIDQVQSIVSNYLSSGDATAILGGLEQKYQIPQGTMEMLYRPLLVSMLTGYVATDAVVPNLPSVPSLPEIPETPTEPDAGEEQQPEIPTEPETGEEQIPEMPTEPDAGEEQQPEIPTEPEKGEEQIPETPAEPDAGEEQQPEIPSEPESGVEQMPEDTVPNEGSEDTENIDATEPVVITLERKTPTEEQPALADDEDPEQGSDEEDLLQPVYANISMGDIDGVVSSFVSGGAVTSAADVAGVAMMSTTVRNMLAQKLQNLLPSIMSYVGSGFYVDEEKLASAFQFNMNEEDLRRLMSAMAGTQTEKTYESNLRSLGYADINKPTSINFYFVDFAGKSEFLDFLDEYNDLMEREEKEDHVIRYTDITSIMMSSVRTIIDSVSYVLIAFVAVSLVVSSIMIGIITYISVMERTKEIGVLRAIGASKRNISQVFNAETFIIGLCSGLIGVGATIALNIPINYIIHHLTNNTNINAQLPVAGALILIALSMILTLIGGLIPSRFAAKKDPVIALRSE